MVAVLKTPPNRGYFDSYRIWRSYSTREPRESLFSRKASLTVCWLIGLQV